MLFTDDLPDGIDSERNMFVVVTNVYSDVRCEMDKHILQEDINTLTSWSKKWLLHFNPTKCKHLIYGKPKYDSTYSMTNTDSE